MLLLRHMSSQIRCCGQLKKDQAKLIPIITSCFLHFSSSHKKMHNITTVMLKWLPRLDTFCWRSYMERDVLPLSLSVCVCVCVFVCACVRFLTASEIVYLHTVCWCGCQHSNTTFPSVSISVWKLSLTHSRGPLHCLQIIHSIVCHSNSWNWFLATVLDVLDDMERELELLLVVSAHLIQFETIV